MDLVYTAVAYRQDLDQNHRRLQVSSMTSVVQSTTIVSDRCYAHLVHQFKDFTHATAAAANVYNRLAVHAPLEPLKNTEKRWKSQPVASFLRQSYLGNIDVADTYDLDDPDKTFKPPNRTTTGL